MEEDQEFYKKLMALMSQNKQLKFRNANAKKTIKIIFDVTDQPDQGSINFQNQPHLNQISHINKNLLLSEQQHKTQVQEIQQNDFKLLPFKNSNHYLQQNFQNIHSLNLTPGNFNTNNKDSFFIDSSKKSSPNLQILDNINASAVKPKKILLGSKHKNHSKPANEAVLNFIENRTVNHNKTHNFIPALESNTAESTHHVSFDIVRSDQTPNKKLSTTSKTANQHIQLLKQLHPQNFQQLQVISQRMMELEKVQKQKLKLDQQISQILSVSFNNSMRLDSFDISMLSALKMGVSSDPLCQIFTQYIKRNNSQKNPNKNTSASFLFLYSQPMLDIHGSQIDEQIDYFYEQSIIQKILKQIKCKIDYIRQRATMDKFHYWMKQSVEILHFCGHGVQQKQNYLLFQGNSGKSVKMDSQTIGKILFEIKTKLKLVFVASCHSQSTGKLFCQAGVSHVICIRDDHVILDQICQQFVRIFYKSCIHDRMDICQAFKFAKKQLELMDKFSKHQIQKFIILHNHPKKECSLELTINVGGQFKDLTFKPYYNKNLPSRVQNFIPRPKDLHEIMKLIDSKKRFITVTGMSGIGKSTLVRQLVRYIQFRNVFIDGVVYVQIRGCQNMSKIIQMLDMQLFDNTPLKHNRTLQQNIQRIVKQLNKRHVLIVLDNCQYIMASEDKQNFKKLIQLIMKNCDDTYFVFTHRTSLSRQIDYCSQKIYELDKLNERQSYNLFFQTIPRSVDKQQLKKFFKIDKGPLKQAQKHPIFQFLNGHPEAICMTASLLSDRSLPQLYQLLLKPVQDLSNQFGIEQKKLNNDITSNKVVETAMKISLNALKNKNKQAWQMIRILSMLPRGLESDMIFKIMGKKCKQNLNKLIDYSLVKIYSKAQFKYYSVHPNIISYVQGQIRTEQKLKYHQKISEQYMKKCQRIYKNVGTMSQQSQKFQEIFLYEQDNYKAIILRELAIYGQGAPLKRFYVELFQGQYFTNNNVSSSYQEEQTFHNKKPLIDLADFESYFNQLNKKAKFNQKMKQSIKKDYVMILVVYYVTNLFVIKKAYFCQKYIEYGVYLSVKKNMYIVAANLIRIKGCIQINKNNIVEARQYFQLAWEMFALEGCGLGAASCQGAVGYIKFLEEEYAMAKMNLQNALKYYVQLGHPFGEHYLNRWLCSLKTKINRAETELLTHKKKVEQLLKEAKLSLKSNNFSNTFMAKHKLGYFVLRFLFANMSLFLQANFQSDVRPKLINQIMKKNINEKMDKPILSFEKPNEQRFQNMKQKQQKPKQSREQKMGANKQNRQQKYFPVNSQSVKVESKDQIKEQSQIMPVTMMKVEMNQISSNTGSVFLGSKRGPGSKAKKQINIRQSAKNMEKGQKE